MGRDREGMGKRWGRDGERKGKGSEGKGREGKGKGKGKGDRVLGEVWKKLL